MPNPMLDQELFDEIQKRFRSDDPGFQRKLFEAIGVGGQCIFVEDFQDPESEEKRLDAIGVWLARCVDWTGQSIMDLAIAAFEDSNYHTLVEKLRNMEL